MRVARDTPKTGHTASRLARLRIRRVNPAGGAVLIKRGQALRGTTLELIE